MDALKAVAGFILVSLLIGLVGWGVMSLTHSKPAASPCDDPATYSATAC